MMCSYMTTLNMITVQQKRTVHVEINHFLFGKNKANFTPTSLVAITTTIHIDDTNLQRMSKYHNVF